MDLTTTYTIAAWAAHTQEFQGVTPGGVRGAHEKFDLSKEIPPKLKFFIHLII